MHATPRYILQLWLCHSPGCSRSWHWQPLAGRRGSSYLRTAGPTPTWPPWLSAPESGWLNSQPDHQCWYAVSVHNYKCIIKFEKVKITNKLSEEACRHFLLKEVLWSYPKCNIFIHTIQKCTCTLRMPLTAHLLRTKGAGWVKELPTDDRERYDVADLRQVLHATIELILKLTIEKAVEGIYVLCINIHVLTLYLYNYG